MSRSPLVSVVIPTYNSGDLLAETLRQLTRQSVPAEDFEVCVGDDGSSDHTAEVVGSFSDSLRVKYHFQEDRGFRVAAARNGAARLAAGRLLIFLDTGSMAGPDFVATHLAAHAPGQPRRAVIGVSYGYNPDVPMQGVDNLLAQMPPEEVVERYRDRPEFQDIRHPHFVACGMDLARLSVPWQLFWGGNSSVRTDDFRQVGGFEENFHGWGGEDMELGYRLQRIGLTFALVPEAWAVVAPHERDHPANGDTFTENMRMLLRRTPVPIVEMGCAVMFDKDDYWLWESSYQELLDWQEQALGLSVRDEIAKAMVDIPEDESIAIIGSGDDLPAALRSATLVEFDERLLSRAVRASNHCGYHSVGLHTPLADDSVGSVIITSRMAGLWGSWGPQILAEAGRIGRRTIAFTDAVQARLK